MRVRSGIKRAGIIILLVLGLLLSSSQSGYAGTVGFTDLTAQQPDYPYVKFLVDRGIINGYGDGTFRPGARLSRAEMAVLMVRAVGLDNQPASTNPHYKDVSPEFWGYAAIEAATAAGLLKGYDDGTFRPDEPVSRAEAAAILLRMTATPLPDVELPAVVKDVPAGHWAESIVAVAIDSAIMPLATKNGFAPDISASRAEAARGLAKMMNMMPEKANVPLAGTLVPLEGKVTMTVKGIDREISVPTSCTAGCRISTAGKSAAEIRFPDGSGLKLNENTAVTITAAQGQATILKNGAVGALIDNLEIKLDKGQLLGALADYNTEENENEIVSKYNRYSNTVASIDNADALRLATAGKGNLPWYKEPYKKKVRVKVDMPAGVAAVRGTIWMNEVGAGRQFTSVVSGFVEVGSGTQMVGLQAGQGTQQSAGQPPAPPQPLTPAQQQTWTQAQNWISERINSIVQSSPLIAAPPSVQQQVQQAPVELTVPPPPQQIPPGPPPGEPNQLDVPGTPPGTSQQNPDTNNEVGQIMDSISQVIGTGGNQTAPPSSSSGNSGGGSSPPSDTTAPSAPDNVASYVQGTDKITVSWDASTDNIGVAGYKVYISATEGSFAEPVTTGTNVTSYTVTGLAPGATRYFQIKAFDSAGNISPGSNVVSATIPDHSGGDLQASITTATIVLGEDVTTAKSTKPGTIYLILDNSDISTQTAAEQAVAAGTARKAYVEAANTDTAISTAGLAPGTYKVMAADNNGNLSVKSEGTITIVAVGSGTAADPYIITTAQSLNEVRNNLDAHYKLAADIDMNKAPYNTGTGWLPIGNYESPFNGTFDGAGYSIKNVMINQPVGTLYELLEAEIFSGRPTGLFVSIGPNAAISNLKLDAVSAAGQVIGGVAGYNNGTIENCLVTGSVKGLVSGGLTGINVGSIRNSCTSTEVESTELAAGGAAGISLGTIINSYSAGSANGILSGGLAGYNMGTIDRCYSADNVSVKELPGELGHILTYLLGGNSCGGLVGCNEGTISNAYSTGAVTGSDTGAAGGLTGLNGNTIIDCYSTGKVTGGSMPGGLVGKAGWSLMDILLEKTSKGTIISSCYDKNTSCQADVGQGVPRTSEQMRQRASYRDWDFTWTWQMKDGEYPTLQNDTVSFFDFDIAGVSSFADIKPDKNTIIVQVASDADITRLVPRFSLPAGAVASINGVTQISGVSSNDFSSPVSYTVTDTGGRSRNWTVTVSAGGVGTIKDPVIIKTADDLNKVRKHMDWNYKLGADIDLNSAPFNAGAGWQPIGNQIAPFTGSFDGAGYSINSLLVNRPEGQNNGLFGYTGESSKLSNIKLMNVTIKGNSYTGVLVGTNNGSISNCCSNGSVNGSDYTGGLVGENSGSISNCCSNGSVNGSDYIGGLAGESSSGTIAYCYAACSVSGSSYSGGLVGYKYDSSNINNSYYDKEISGQSDTGKGEPKTTAEMKEQGTYTGWDFINTWSITAGEYPTLRSSISISFYSFKGINGQTNIDHQSRVITISLPAGTNLTALAAEYTLSAGAAVYIDETEQISGETANDFSNPIIYTLTPAEGDSTAWTVIVNALSEGTGTVSDPYIIKTAGQLGCIRNYPDCHFELGADIDLGIAPYNTGAGWEPITNFKGTFDGAGYTVRNLFINRPDKNDVGLFASIAANARLFNVKLEAINIIGYTYTGGLSGNNYGHIYDSTVSGNISGNGDYTGGMLGFNGGLINNCSASGTITGSSNNGITGTGGLVGKNNGSVTNSHTSGNVNANANYAGGLAGYNSSGSISTSYSCASVSSSELHGGYIGGLAGWNNGSISESYSSGSVTGKGCGGLVGYHTDGKISNCYSSGLVSGSSLSGGMVAYILTKAVVSSSYYDRETSGQSDTGKGEPKTTAEMQTQTTYTGWDFINTWSILPDEYPTLHVSASILTYSFKGIAGSINIDQPNRVIIAELPPGSNLTELVAEYSLSPGADAYINNDMQVSGETSNDFSSPVIYTMQTGTGNSVTWTVAVSMLAEGTGTGTDPYIIRTAGQLDSIRNHPDSHFKLGADIDLNMAPYNTGTGWQPVGSSNTPFTGSFDGAGYTIDGLFINRPGYDYNGLFGYTGINAVLSNIKLMNVSIEGKSYTGSLAGYNYGSIESCCSSGSVCGNSCTGGLTGNNAGKVTASYSSAVVSGNSDIGGLAGENNGNIINCYSNGNIRGNSYTGGLVGNNYGSINNCYASSSVIGNGGLVGYNSSNSNVTNSYYDKEVSGKNDTGKGEPKSTEEMQTQATYAGWDFVNTWSIQPGAYPTLYTGASILTYSFQGITGTTNIDRQNRFITMEVAQGSNLSQLVAEYTLSGGAAASINGIVQASGVTSNDFSNPVAYTVTAPGGNPIEWTVIVSTLGEGNGTLSDPYIIRTAGQLDCIKNHLDAHFKLGADIDLGVFPYNSGAGWQPIGNGDEAFTGSFDGAGYTISNLFINRTGEEGTGLFCCTGSNAVLTDIVMGNVSVNGGWCSGSLVGYNLGCVTNCSVSGNISSSSYSGGLVGQNHSNISNCYFAGDVIGSYYLGGLVGQNYGSINNSHASGNVSSDSYYIGGLVGDNEGSISNCYASGNVSSDSYNIGGLVGENDGSIRNCYASGDVAGDSDIGGLAGGNYVSISNCYASGRVSGDSDIGGLVGDNYRSISNCYYDKEKTGQHDLGKGIPKTSAEMKNQSTYVGWDFVSIWSITAEAYPVILMQSDEKFPAISAYNFDGVSGQAAINHDNRCINVELPQGTSMENLVAVFTLNDGASATINDTPQTSGETANDFTSPLTYKLADTNGRTAQWNVTVSILAEGTGSTDAPYIIKTASELDCVRNHLNSCFKLGEDIDLSLSCYGRGAGWMPVGSPTAPFNGAFDGDGYIIRNLVISRPQNDYTGLFGYLGSQAMIKNVNLEEVMVAGREYTGALTGDNHGVINTSCVSGTVNGTYLTGGLAGANSRGSISNCCSSAGVTGTVNAGGLTAINSGSIMYCYNSGHVSGDDAGGLVGSQSGIMLMDVDSSGWGGSAGGTIRDSYYDMETAGDYIRQSIHARTTAQMKQEATYSGWDFDSTWSIAENQYPRLKNVTDVYRFNIKNQIGPAFISYEKRTIMVKMASETNFASLIADFTLAPGAAASVNGKIQESGITANNFSSPVEYIITGPNGKKCTWIVTVSEDSANPYIIINSADELNAMRDNLNGRYQLGADIDLGAEPYNTDRGWVPVGDSEQPFNGLLDGKGHSISNLCINRPDGQYSGLFGDVGPNAVLANIRLVNVSIAGGDYTGGLAGNNQGVISNSSISGDVRGSGNYAGGMAAINYGNINNSCNKASVTGGHVTGGLVGQNYGSIGYCYSTGLVSSSSSDAGGLVGCNEGYVSYSYYDQDTSGRVDQRKGQPQTTAEMKQQASYEGWDFDTIWSIDEGNSYPVLGLLANAAPEARAVFIKGVAAPGQVLTGVYSYYDAEGDREGNSSFQWYRGSLDTGPVAIDGATERTYTLAEEDAGQNIYFEVIPAALDGAESGNWGRTMVYIPLLPVQLDQLLWLQGDEGTTMNEDNQLTSWQDQSLCGNDTLESGSDAWPKVVGEALNGHAVIRFDGWQNRVVFLPLEDSLPQATTIMVLKNDSSDDRDLLSVVYGGNDTDGSIRFMRQGMMYVGGKADYNLAVPTSEFRDGFNILVITADASGTKNMRVYLNEILQAELFYDAGIYENMWSIAGSNSTDYDHCFKGDIAEMMVYQGIISEERITDIVTYLKNKYALE